MDNEEVNVSDNHEYLLYLQYLQDPQPQVLHHKLEVFHGNHVIHQRENDIHNHDQQIHSALSSMRFYDGSVYVQLWVPIDFQSRFVLTTCGQLYGHSIYSKNEFGSYRVACFGHNSYVDCNKGKCIGPPARVFLNQSPEWTQDVSKYNDKQYPQLHDAKLSNIGGSLFMPVRKDGRCIGVLEFAMTNVKDNFAYEMGEVCRALKEEGLESSVQNESINFDTLEDYSPLFESPNTLKKTRNSKSKMIARNDITKLFGLSKADAIKICRIWYNFSKLSENTFTKAHRISGVYEWPCTRSGIVKSSAHMALIEHAKTYLTSSDVARTTEHIRSQLMEDNNDITWEGNLVDKHMEYLISNDGKRVREQLDESASHVLLELHQHKNKRSRN